MAKCKKLPQKLREFIVHPIELFQRIIETRRQLLLFSVCKLG